MLSSGVLIAGKYRVSKKLGEGAMGSVWLAKNEITDREFAIKVLLPQAAASSTGLARFLREARVCGALRHPSILEIYDAGESPELGGAPYLVMERLEGAPLDVVIRDAGALSPRLAIDILIQISRGLQLAHAKGIVHRDLKPANVFLHNPGTGAIEPKVLDFGISKVVDPATPQVALTHTSAILGSPMYMSPEQMGVGTVFDARSDVHALGILLWECLTGRAPFVSTSYNLLVVEIIQGPRPKLREALPWASPELARIVERAFAIDPQARYGSTADFADELELELARLGGGVMSARTAARDVLGGLDLEPKPPTHAQSTTHEPISIDPSFAPGVMSPTARSVGGTMVSRGSIPGSPLGSSPSLRSSPASFAETELAAPTVPSVHGPIAAASSAPGSRPAVKRSPAWPLAVAGVVLAGMAITGVTLALRHSAPPETPLTSDSSAAVQSAPAADAVPAATAAAPAPLPATPASSAAPLASASVTPPTPRPQAAEPSKRATPSHAHPTTVPTATASARSRIDQSGL